LCVRSTDFALVRFCRLGAFARLGDDSGHFASCVVLAHFDSELGLSALRGLWSVGWWGFAVMRAYHCHLFRLDAPTVCSDVELVTESCFAACLMMRGLGSRLDDCAAGCSRLNDDGGHLASFVGFGVGIVEGGASTYLFHKKILPPIFTSTLPAHVSPISDSLFAQRLGAENPLGVQAISLSTGCIEGVDGCAPIGLITCWKLGMSLGGGNRKTRSFY